jgi:hypothetical protein
MYYNDSDEDVPLLSLEKEKDSDSILLDLNNPQHITEYVPLHKQHNLQQDQDRNSRNIIRFYIFTFIIITFSFTFLILGYCNYHDTSSDEIIYGSNGVLLFRYYYLINFCWYVIFILFSMYIFLFIFCCLKITQPVRDKTIFKFLKLNSIIFSLNIFTKMLYGLFIVLLNENESKNCINSIPKYYNYIIIEIVIYMTTQIFNYKFIHLIDNLIKI